MRCVLRNATGSGQLMTRQGNCTFDCGGAQIRAHCRSLATVVTMVTGALVYHFRIRPRRRIDDSAAVETY